MVIFMKKIITIVGVLLVLLVLVVGGIIIVFVKNIDPNSYKDKISQVVYDNTGRTLSLNGNISWSFFPWLGMKVQDVALSNAAYFKNTPFVSAAEIDVTVRLIPLIFGKIEIGTVVLKDLNLNLVKNTAGENNWHDLFDGSSGKDSGHEKSKFIFAQGIDIQNAKITWDNQQVGKTITIKNFYFSGQRINLQRPFAVKSDFEFDSSQNVSGNVHLESLVILNVRDQLYALDDAVITGAISGDHLAGKLEFRLATDAAVDLNKQTFDMHDLTVRLANMNLDGLIKGVSIIDAPTFNGNLYIASFDPKPLLKVFGYTCAEKVCNRAAAELTVETASKFLKVPKISVQFDDAKINGSGSYSHFDDKNAVFNLAISQLDLDRILNGIKKLSPAIGTTAPKAKVTAVKHKRIVANNEDDFYAALRDIHFNGDLTIDSFKLDKLTSQDVKIQINSEGDVINLNPVTFKFYQGNAQGGVAINFRRNVPAFQSKINLSAVNLEQLFAAYFNDKTISGTATFNANVSTYGKESNTLLRNLNGSGNLAITNGAINGVDVKYQLERAHALLNQQPLPHEVLPSRTPFDQLTASFNLRNGLLSNNDLWIRASYYKVLGNGTANLATQVLDYQLQAYGMRDNKPTDFFVPIKITGTFSSPKVAPDVAVLVQKIVTDAVKHQLNKVITDPVGNVVPKHLMHDLGKELNKVFR